MPATAKRRENKKDYTVTILVDKSPKEAFDAINNVRGWWSGDIEGKTDRVGSVWTYRYKDVHYSKQRIAQLVPGKRIVWNVLDGYLNFVKDKSEWKGTKIIFDISRTDNKTEVRFTHQGLVPDIECYGQCTDAWGFYIRGSLKSLITKGKGEPNE